MTPNANEGAGAGGARWATPLRLSRNSVNTIDLLHETMLTQIHLTCKRGCKMGTVIEFPRSGSDGASTNLGLISDALTRIMERDGDWYDVENVTHWITDRAGTAVLSIEKFLCNGVRLALRWWNDDRHDYDEQFYCFLRLSRRGVESAFGDRGIQLSPTALVEVQNVLDVAERSLAAGSVVRIVN